MLIAGIAEGRTILLHDDATPVLIGINVREATTAPARLKCTLMCPPITEGGDPIPLPFAVPVVAEAGRKPRGFTPEFRLEMN